MRELLFDIFYKFYETECNIKRVEYSAQASTIEQMDKANLMDGEGMKKYRRRAHGAVHSYIEMFRRVESLKQATNIGKF